MGRRLAAKRYQQLLQWTMKLYLTKKNIKTVDFVLFEQDDKFVRKSSGKVGKSGVANSTMNAGSPDKAKNEIAFQVRQLIEKGFVQTSPPDGDSLRDVTFDKAKWHLNSDFPPDLNPNQVYVHTGLFVTWLIENDLFDSEFKNQNTKGIQALLSRNIFPSQFYAEYLDGIFDADGLKEDATDFTSEYFDFEKGKYVTDYLATLDPDDKLPTIFHIQDTWENFDKLRPVLNERFQNWTRDRVMK